MRGFFYGVSMKDLIIIAKGPAKFKPINLKTEDNEIWMLGTDPRAGGDFYFELHNIKITNHQNVIYEVPDVIYELGLPINNSISALLVYAYILGFKNVELLCCPMDGAGEYESQRPALAYVIGYLNGRGMNIKWPDLPKNKDYGRK